ncbi:MAG: D-alanine--D-alanine ligase [Desulfovibrionales bacterium]
MRVAVVHNEVGGSAAADEADVLVQAECVVGALGVLGHDSRKIACTLDLATVRDRIVEYGPDVVFNLVESLDGSGRLIHLLPFLLQAMNIPFTGAPAEAVMITSHKVLSKQIMVASGLPTPKWIGHVPMVIGNASPLSEEVVAGSTWIIKSVWEHASLGLDSASILQPESRTELEALLSARAPLLGGECFAEGFVHGREFNLALLAGPEGVQVLPPAEIEFRDFGPHRPRIVDYRAKWDENSFEYRNTPRTFDFPPGDTLLLHRLTQLAQSCWQVFGLKGYARVDFRVDDGGRPFILEINANPCLSPDAGYHAALLSAGTDFPAAVDRILQDALRHKP